MATSSTINAQMLQFVCYTAHYGFKNDPRSADRCCRRLSNQYLIKLAPSNVNNPRTWRAAAAAAAVAAADGGAVMLLP
jgi:hypothetical protein